jgi:23S rRNA (adenine2503-C2)-methyltransferase
LTVLLLPIKGDKVIFYKIQVFLLMEITRQNIKMLIPDDLEGRIVGMGLKKYRAAQVFQWIYGRGAESFDEMTNIAKAERTLLADRFFISAIRVLKTEVSVDGTRKFLFELEDKHTLESVLIPEEDRSTLCISSQVGCAQACRFCLTGSGGFRRNLEAFEIADQVSSVEKMLAMESKSGRLKSTVLEDGRRDRAGALHAASRAVEVLRDRTRLITNIVLMGMGEPLANFDNVVKALKIITADKGLGFSPRRVTLSTDGLVPEIEKLGSSGMKVNLAVSLNATTDEVRDRIMPVNRRYPIKELLAACGRFPLDERRRITFEYALLREVNDSEADALRLAKLLRGIRCKVNLIPFNPFPGSEFRRPDDLTVRRFQKILLDHHYTAPVRESRGRDISAACGQLRERETAARDERSAN